MITIKRNEAGFSAVESALLLVIVVTIGLVGWYIYHANQTANKNYNAANSTGAQPQFASKTQRSSGDTSNASLQSGLQSASSSANQGNKDMSNANNSLNDQSTLTSVPQ